MGTISVTLVGVGLLTLACGLTEEEHGVASTGRGQSAAGAGGSDGAGAAGTEAAGAAGAGAAGDVTVVCPTEQAVDVLSASTDYRLEEREIDPAFTCELDPCPITRALDLVGPASPSVPRDASMAVTAETTMVLSGAQRMTVGAAGASADDVSWLSYTLTAADEQGNSWLFGRTIAGQTNPLPMGITAVRETEGRWMASTVAASADAAPDAELSGVVMVDDSLGYLIYLDGAGEIPHLVTWDGSCWTDETLVAEPRSLLRAGRVSAVVQIDHDQRPWVAWQAPDSDSRWLYLRGPDGDTQSLMAYPAAATTTLVRLGLSAAFGSDRLVELERVAQLVEQLVQVRDGSLERHLVPCVQGAGIVTGVADGDHRGVDLLITAFYAGRCRCSRASEELFR